MFTFQQCQYFCDPTNPYWFKDGFIQQAEYNIKKLFKKQEYCYSQAPEHLRSIPGIGHFHIFVKK